jgi:hypothetical protein
MVRVDQDYRFEGPDGEVGRTVAGARGCQRLTPSIEPTR